jgi:uncharacterized UPF0146 family protein
MEKSGIELIAIEREEQFKKHGRTISEDAMQNPNRELVAGASALLMPIPSAADFPKYWDKNIVAKMVAKAYKERLVIAGAFLCAEIDRLNLVENFKNK